LRKEFRERRRARYGLVGRLYYDDLIAVCARPADQRLGRRDELGLGLG
jgi:hypothetical protein